MSVPTYLDAVQLRQLTNSEANDMDWKDETSSLNIKKFGHYSMQWDTDPNPYIKSGSTLAVRGIEYNLDADHYLLSNTPSAFDTPSIFDDVAKNSDESLIVALRSRDTYVSTDQGATWTHYVDAIDSTYAGSAITFGNGLFVVGGTQGFITTSTDGQTWTQRRLTAGTYDNTMGAAYSGSYFRIAWRNNGVGGYFHSADGISWTKTTISGAGNINAITYGNGYWVLTDAAGQIYRATETGTALLQHTDPDGRNLWKVTYSAVDNQFLVAGHYGKVFKGDSTASTWTQVGSTVLPDTCYFYGAHIFDDILVDGNPTWMVSGYAPSTSISYNYISNDEGATWSLVYLPYQELDSSYRYVSTSIQIDDEWWLFPVGAIATKVSAGFVYTKYTWSFDGTNVNVKEEFDYESSDYFYSDTFQGWYLTSNPNERIIGYWNDGVLTMVDSDKRVQE